MQIGAPDIYRDLVSIRGSGSKINLLERLVEQAMNMNELL